MTSLETFAAIWCVLIVISLGLLWWLFSVAPLGFEDDAGFHAGEPKGFNHEA